MFTASGQIIDGGDGNEGLPMMYCPKVDFGPPKLPSILDWKPCDTVFSPECGAFLRQTKVYYYASILVVCGCK